MRFLALMIAFCACTTPPPDVDYAGPPSSRGAAAEKADEAATQPPLECGALEAAPALEELSSLGELTDALGAALAENGDDCVVFEEWAAGAEGAEPEPHEDYEAPLEEAEEEDPLTEAAYARFLERVERMREDPLAQAAALELAGNMFGTNDLEDSELAGLSPSPLAEYAERFPEGEDHPPLDPYEEVVETELDPEFIEASLGQPEPEEDAEEIGAHRHALTGSCSDPESFWPPGVDQPSDYAQGKALAVVVYLDRPNSGFLGMSGGRFGPWERQRVRDSVRVSQKVWRDEARARGGKLDFTTREYTVNMSHLGADANKWTENQMIYTTIQSFGGIAGRNLRTERWGAHGQARRHADLHQVGHDMRRRVGADHVYFVFAVDGGYQTGPTFKSGHGAYAYANGGMMFVNFSAWGFGINDYSVSHELGHVFGALDHYSNANVSCSKPSGYLGVPTTIQENGASRRAEGCVPWQPDVMDRFSKVWGHWTLNGGRTPFTDVTARQTGMVPIDEAPRLDARVTGAWRFSSFFGSSQPLSLFSVKYETEVGAKARHHSVNRGKRHLSKTRLRSIDYEQAAGGGALGPVKLRAGSRTQVQCGTVLFYKWGAPPSRLRMRSTDQFGRQGCAEISTPRRGARVSTPNASCWWW